MAAMSAGFVACGRRRAGRYFGWLFVASAAERSLAIADLAEFRRTGSIALPHAPAQILRVGRRVFVTCPDAQSIYEIDTAHHQLASRIDLGGRIVNATVSPVHPEWIAVITESQSALIILDTADRKILRRIPLRNVPVRVDAGGSIAAVASVDGAVIRVSIEDGKIQGSTSLGTGCSALRFRNDGQIILAGCPGARQVIAIDAATGSLLARMPLPFAPAEFCFNGDGGQMFVTGDAEDSIAIVQPYQSQVDQTIIAGHNPSGMAVAEKRNLLLVTNPASGDLTILDIETRLLAASVHVGGTPSEVVLTPDEEYALVVSRDSGDVAVLRLNTVLDHKIKTKPLFTVFAMAAAPQSLAILPEES